MTAADHDQLNYCPAHCAGPSCSYRLCYPCCGACMEDARPAKCLQPGRPGRAPTPTEAALQAPQEATE